MHAYRPDKLVKEETFLTLMGDIFSAHPILSGGASLSVLAMSAIFVNAVWFQPFDHPAPLFGTRLAEKSAPAVPAAIPAAKPNEEVKVVKAAVKTVEVPDETTRELLHEVQSALATRGYYNGKVDGIAGSRTKKAVIDFQQDHDLTVDGKPTVRLLTKILLSGSSVPNPNEVPVPEQRKAKPPVVQMKADTKTVETKAESSKAAPKPGTVEEKAKAALEKVEAKPEPVKMETAEVKVKATPAPTGFKDAAFASVTANETEAPVADPSLVAAIQSGLKNYGYDELEIDGKIGDKTSRAIQRFELDYGMTITGEASSVLLKKLQDIGALKSG